MEAAKKSRATARGHHTRAVNYANELCADAVVDPPTSSEILNDAVTPAETALLEFEKHHAMVCEFLTEDEIADDVYMENPESRHRAARWANMLRRDEDGYWH